MPQESICLMRICQVGPRRVCRVVMELTVCSLLSESFERQHQTPRICLTFTVRLGTHTCLLSPPSRSRLTRLQKPVCGRPLRQLSPRNPLRRGTPDTRVDPHFTLARRDPKKRRGPASSTTHPPLLLCHPTLQSRSTSTSTARRFEMERNSPVGF